MFFSFEHLRKTNMILGRFLVEKRGRGVGGGCPKHTRALARSRAEGQQEKRLDLDPTGFSQDQDLDSNPKAKR
jgi:hypothetical protein